MPEQNLVAAIARHELAKENFEIAGQVVRDGLYVEVASNRDCIRLTVNADKDVVIDISWDEASELIGNLGRACRWHKRMRELYAAEQTP